MANGKEKGKQGFASNPSGINRGGRPRGAKSRNTVEDAIKRFESNTLDAAQVIIAIMQGNKDFLEVDEVKVSERLNAAKYVIKAPTEIAKDNKTSETIEEEETSNEEEQLSSGKVVPLVQMRS